MELTAKVTRSGKWWAIEVPELEGLFTQARRLDMVEAMVRDAAAMLTDRPASDFEIHLEVADASFKAAVAEYREAAESSRQAAARASQLSRSTALAFMKQGLPVRDVAQLLGISPQRVSQLTKVDCRKRSVKAD